MSILSESFVLKMVRGKSASPLLNTGRVNPSDIFVHRCAYLGYTSTGSVNQFHVVEVSAFSVTSSL